MTDIWNKRRDILEASVKEAALNLFGHTGSNAFSLPIGDGLLVNAGPEDSWAIVAKNSVTVSADDIHWFEDAFRAWDANDMEGTLDGLTKAVNALK